MFVVVVFGQMLEALPNDGADMIICQKIIDGFALPARGHQLIFPQHFKLMRNGGLGHSQKFCDGTDAKFGFKQGIQNPHTGGIAKHFKEI